MTNIKFLSFSAALAIGILLYLAMTMSGPLDRKYDALVQKIMKEQAITSEHEMFKDYPELQQLQVQIEEVKALQYNIRQHTQGTVPSSEGQSLYLLNQVKKLKSLKKNIELSIDRMGTTRSILASSILDHESSFFDSKMSLDQ